MKALLAAAATLALGLLATPASAEVVSRTEDGFILRYRMSLDTTPQDIIGAMSRVGEWWDSDHTYSGDAGNISVDLTPGGCWCEAMPDAEPFRHGTTREVAAGHLLFDAPFGPLNGKATKADLRVEWPAASRGHEITWTMTIEGPGLGALAGPVDGVMGAGFGRFVRFLDTGEPSAGASASDGE